MRGKSKRESVNLMIRQAVRDQILESAFHCNGLREAMKAAPFLLDQIVNGSAYNLTDDRYRMKELADIMSWKQGPRKQ